MDVLQKCFDQNTYDYTDDQVTKILGALEAKLADLRSASGEWIQSHTIRSVS